MELVDISCTVEKTIGDSYREDRVIGEAAVRSKQREVGRFGGKELVPPNR